MTKAQVPSRTNTNKIDCLPHSLLTLWKNATSVKTNKNVSKAREDNLRIMRQTWMLVIFQKGSSHQYAMKKDGAPATRQSGPNDILGNTKTKTAIIMAISAAKRVTIANKMVLF
ncbi:hypothetical protein PHLCEN_2v8482 [Hermanssonia centrifuga]|uniref:Uncharacterized protein n=1 Tax=Hermanssonia centrifuga TaxID=98765 RepID=A0A2R6NTJ1_9APHY|nr:hypothetical protein PHLCEN_2v8482 [Hermanssonia centrifuga]